MLLPDLPADGMDARGASAQRVSAALAEPVEVEGAEFHVSASLGVSIFPRLAVGGEELLRQADTAMYQAKRAGRSGHVVYTPEEQHPLDRLSLTARLRRSIDAQRAGAALPADLTRSRADSPRPWRRSCAGTTPRAGWCRPPRSSRPPSTAA